MTTDPKRLGPEDTTPAHPLRRRHPAHLDGVDDATPEELEERAAYVRRVGEFEKLAKRARELNASPANLAVQEDTRAGLERIWRSNAPTRAAERAVPPRPDVRRVALAAEPPRGDALDGVRAGFAWRARESARTGSERVPLVLVLLSPAGGGKSSAAGWACTWHRESALYTTAARVAASPLTAHSDSRAPWSALVAPDLLAIDEIGREGGERGPTAVQALYLERDQLGRATLLLGNLLPEEFEKRYLERDEAIASRFEQQRAAGCEPIVAFGGRDLRLPFVDDENGR